MVLLAGLLITSLSLPVPAASAGNIEQRTTVGAAPTTAAAGASITAAAGAASITSAALAVSAGTALVRRSGGGYWAFAVKANGQIFQTIKGASGWGSSGDLGGPFKAGPAATYSAGDHVDLYAVGTDGALKTSIYDNGRWSGWAVIARGFSGGLSALRLPSGELHVFGLGTNGSIYQVRRLNGRWVPPVNLGAGFRYSSSALYDAASHTFNLFSIGTDGRIRHRYYNHGWSSWTPATVSIGFQGVAAAQSGSTVKIYAVSNNRQLYEFSRTAGRWTTPASLGGGLIGSPAATISGGEIRVVANRIDGLLGEIGWRRSWTGWMRMPGSGFPRIVAAAPTRAQLAGTLVSRWGGRLTGLPGVLADLKATAAGQAIRNSSSCNNAVYLDARMLTTVVAATNRYRVFVNNMVTGHGCGAGYHPEGKAVDFNTVVDPATGRSTNWHSGESGDNVTLDVQFLTYVAGSVPSGGGAGQRYCTGRSGARLPSGMAFFDDFCNHQHLDTRP